VLIVRTSSGSFVVERGPTWREAAHHLGVAPGGRPDANLLLGPDACGAGLEPLGFVLAARLDVLVPGGERPVRRVRGELAHAALASMTRPPNKARPLTMRTAVVVMSPGDDSTSRNPVGHGFGRPFV
jgi:hypothetical protein